MHGNTVLDKGGGQLPLPDFTNHGNLPEAEANGNGNPCQRMTAAARNTGKEREALPYETGTRLHNEGRVGGIF